MPITMVDNDWELKEAKRAARVDLYDNNDRGIFTDVDVVKTPRGQSMLSIAKQIERVQDNDVAGNGCSLRAVKAEDAKAVFDIGVCNKVEDVVFPFYEKIKYYGPLSDVHSDNMKVFITEEAGDIVSGAGVDLNLFDEELSEIESVPATTDQHDLAKATYKHREQIESLHRQLAVWRSRIEFRHPDWASLDHDAFVQKVIKEGVGEDCSNYLKLEARLIKNKRFIDKYSSAIMQITLPKVFIPDHIEEADIRLPLYDVKYGCFADEKLSIDDVNALANQRVEDIETVEINEIPEIAIDL